MGFTDVASRVVAGRGRHDGHGAVAAVLVVRLRPRRARLAGRGAEGLVGSALLVSNPNEAACREGGQSSGGPARPTVSGPSATLTVSVTWMCLSRRRCGDPG